MLDIDIERISSIAILHIHGMISIETVNDFEDEFKKEIEKKPEIIALNCGSLSYLDSIGIKYMVKLSKTAIVEEIDVILYDLNHTIKKIFEVSTLDRYFNIISKEQFAQKYL